MFILTTVTPFSVSQDRFVVIESTYDARLVICRGSTPRTAFNHGQTQHVAPETLNVFLERLAAAEAAWNGDAIPVGVSDGVTITVEQAAAGDYRRVRMVEPPEGSPHERLLAAWMVTFPGCGARIDVGSPHTRPVGARLASPKKPYRGEGFREGLERQAGVRRPTSSATPACVMVIEYGGFLRYY